MVKMMPEFQTAVGVTAIVTSQALMADPINMPVEGVNELYSGAARTAIRLSEVGDNQFEAQLIDVRTHRLSTIEFELNEDGSVNVLASETGFYSNGVYKNGIMPDEAAIDAKAGYQNIAPEQTQTLENLMLTNPDVWPFAGGEPATGDTARIAETENGNMMGTCIIIPNADAESQAAFCLQHEFNKNTTITTTATMHIATENGLVSSHILTDEIGWFEGPGDTNTSGPVIPENIDRGLSQGLTYGNPSVM